LSTHIDPTSNRPYVIGPDGRSRWADEPLPTAALPAQPGHARPATAKRRGPLVPILAAAGTGLVGLLAGVGIGAAPASDTVTTAGASTVTVTKTAAGTGAATVTVTGKAPAPAAKTVTVKVTQGPPKAKAAMGEGSYLVGEDIAPGRYRMIEAAGGNCYWGIYRAGTNQADIIQNDIVTGGRATVTLKKGQEFDSTGCGDWAKA
jgi:hypothetical protein